MSSKQLKFVLIGAILLIIGLVCTCEFSQPAEPPATPLQDTIFLSQWRREKKEKQELVKAYEKKLEKLQSTKDSLQADLAEHKKSLSAYRFKAKIFQEQLREKVAKADSSTNETEEILPLVDSLITSQAQSDTACDSTIFSLENIVLNRDSTISVHLNIESQLKDIQKNQETENAYLTGQLDAANKALKHNRKANKLMKAGLFFLTGLTTSLLIKNSIK